MDQILFFNCYGLLPQQHADILKTGSCLQILHPNLCVDQIDDIAVVAAARMSERSFKNLAETLHI